MEKSQIEAEYLPAGMALPYAMSYAMEILVEIAKRAEAAPDPVSGHSVIDEIAKTAKAKLTADIKNSQW